MHDTPKRRRSINRARDDECGLLHRFHARQLDSAVLSSISPINSGPSLQNVLNCGFYVILESR